MKSPFAATPLSFGYSPLGHFGSQSISPVVKNAKIFPLPIPWLFETAGLETTPQFRQGMNSKDEFVKRVKDAVRRSHKQFWPSYEPVDLFGRVKAFADGFLGSRSALFYEPEHLLVEAASVNKKLGIDRAQKGSYLFHSLLASNVDLAFGSDWPVVDINPLGGLTAAMKRIPPAWDIAWVPAESVSLNESLKAYTLSAARACFLDSDLGSLPLGKLADFVILSAYLWDGIVAEGSASIDATYVGGVKAYP